MAAGHDEPCPGCRAYVDRELAHLREIHEKDLENVRRELDATAREAHRIDEVRLQMVGQARFGEFVKGYESWKATVDSHMAIQLGQRSGATERSSSLRNAILVAVALSTTILAILDFVIHQLPG